MILHVTFTDGSNPWVSLPTDRHTVAKFWRQWMKNHPDTARPIAKSETLRVSALPDGSYSVHTMYQNPMVGRKYKRLGNALRVMEGMSKYE